MIKINTAEPETFFHVIPSSFFISFNEYVTHNSKPLSDIAGADMSDNIASSVATDGLYYFFHQ